MIFKPELILKIASGEKIQMRRPVKAGEKLHNGNVYLNERLKIAVGRDYAVQPGRGKPGLWWCWQDRNVMALERYERYVAAYGEAAPYYLHAAGFSPMRILIDAIRQQDVRDISHDDAIAEGFSVMPKYAFLETWCGFYDPAMVKELWQAEYVGDAPNHCPVFLGGRRAELYQAWAYTFEVGR